jgi:hypothetical protein
VSAPRLMLAMAVAAFAGDADAAASFRVDGTSLVLGTDAGEERRNVALEGQELDLGALGVWRILRVTRDAEARFPDETWLVDATMRPPGATEFVNACSDGSHRDSRAIFYAGYLDAQLRYVADPDRFSISCVSGVEAKCLRWGYLPWRDSPIGSRPLAPYFETCLRLARADYCGDGAATTREGTAIDAYDEVGIMQRTPDLPEFAFEAGWNTAGAVCAHHARIPENLDLASLPTTCARLAQAPLGASCDEERARELGALIVTRSVIRTAAPVAPAARASH